MEQSTPYNKFIEIFREGSRKIGWEFSESTLDIFWCYYQELCLWDRAVNLTGLSDEKERIGLLFLDSLHGRLVLEESQFQNIVDLGTGAGFPGIPLQILFPEKRIALVESKAKKAAFLLNVVGKLNLSGSRVIQKRIEDIGKNEHRCEKWDLAMIKGVNISHVFPYLKNILNENGKLMVFRSKNFDQLGSPNEMKLFKEYAYQLPFGFGERMISLFEFI